MKRWIVTGALVLSMIFTLGLASNASAVGRAAGLIVSTGTGSVVALIDFNEVQFTQIEAQQLSVFLQFGGSVLLNLLTGNAPGVTVSLVVVTPDQMIRADLGDADNANTFIVNNFAALGVDAYIKAVATKVDPPQGVTGQNIRLDLHLFSGTDSTFQYVASLEVSKQVIDQFGLLLSPM